METAQLVSVEEYLHTSYEYDAEYVEGRIVQRALPERFHSGMQGYVYVELRAFGLPLGYRVWPELRIRTQSEPQPRYRVPDICVTKGKPSEQILTGPPFLCVEILSPDDAALEVRSKIDEYLQFGVASVWVIDPFTKRGEIYTSQGITPVHDGVFKAGDLVVNLRNM